MQSELLQSELLRRRTLRVARVCARACVYLCVRACCVCVHSEFLAQGGNGGGVPRTPPSVVSLQRGVA